MRNVARLVPATNVLTEWSFSPDAEFTQNMILGSASLFFGTDSPVALNQLDPTAAGSDSTLSLARGGRLGLAGLGGGEPGRHPPYRQAPRPRPRPHQHAVRDHARPLHQLGDRDAGVRDRRRGRSGFYFTGNGNGVSGASISRFVP